MHVKASDKFFTSCHYFIFILFLNVVNSNLNNCFSGILLQKFFENMSNIFSSFCIQSENEANLLSEAVAISM